MNTEFTEKNVVVAGIGQSEIRRPSQKSAIGLTVDACLQAITDAGLTPEEIDGLSMYPAPVDNGSGFAPVSVNDMRWSLGIRPKWHSSAGPDSAGHLTGIFNAINAIAAGMAKHVLVFRTTSEATARAIAPHNTVLGGKDSSSQRIWGHTQWMFPYNVVTGTPLLAMYAQRHFHLYGTRSDQLGQIAVNARRMAALNPAAIFRTPITLDDYMNARMISTPLRLFDCDIHVDGSTAIVLSRRGTLPDRPGRRTIRVEAVGSAMDRRGTLCPDNFDSIGAEAAAQMMWSRTDLRPRDIDNAHVYDGYSIVTLNWLEAIGVCGKGEGGPFLEGGENISLTGMLPMNTSGGQIAAGRLQGYGHTHEACTQLWGRAGARQVKDAKVSLVTNGGMGLGCMLLVAE